MSRTEQPEHWAYELKERTVRLLRLLNALPPAYLSRLAERYLRRPDQPGGLVRSTSHQPVSTKRVQRSREMASNRVGGIPGIYADPLLP